MLQESALQFGIDGYINSAQFEGRKHRQQQLDPVFNQGQNPVAGTNTKGRQA